MTSSIRRSLFVALAASSVAGCAISLEPWDASPLTHSTDAATGTDATAVDTVTPPVDTFVPPADTRTAPDSFFIDDNLLMDTIRRDVVVVDNVVPHDNGPPVDSGFVPAPHTALPQIPDQGGRRLAHPQIVTVTYPGYPYVDQVEEFGDFVVGSQWLTTVGAEYGVGTGTQVGKVRLTTPAPRTIDDRAIQRFVINSVVNGTFPAPSGEPNDYLYIIYYPMETTITEQGATSCQEFAGYHGSASNGTINVSYSVIPLCPGGGGDLSDLDMVTVASSHELIEAATDADPLATAAFQIPFDMNNPSTWILLGGEVGDLCAYEYTHEGAYTLQRNWSNAAAAQDQNPCIPSNGDPYFSVSAQPEEWIQLAAGQTTTVQLTGWSTAFMPDWLVGAQVTSGTFAPTVNLDTQTMNNGRMSTLTISVPAGTASGNYAGFLVFSANSTQTKYYYYPMAVYVP